MSGPYVPDHIAARTADLLGLMDVHRWTVIKTMRRQSVAEHSFGVAVIAMELAQRLGVQDATDMSSILSWALVHDAPETLTGDIDGKFKRQFPEVKSAITAAERKAFPGLAAVTDHSVHTIPVQIVKVADKIEAIAWISVWGLGPRADHVKRELTEILVNESVPKLASALEARALDDGDTVCPTPPHVQDMVMGILNRSVSESHCYQLRNIGGNE